MNIFVLDEDPSVAAQMACDKHVIKMILETAQMLCTVAHHLGVSAPYVATHKRHPCNLWVGASKENWDWLVEHGIALCAEYTKRYGRVHKSQQVIEYCSQLDLNFPQQDRTPFAQAMPPQYKDPCAVMAYRAYYHGEKARFATWKTQPPKWWHVV